MQYGSIGWSVGAVLGYAIGAADKRVIACIGDGSFQVRTRVDQNPTQTVPDFLWHHYLSRAFEYCSQIITCTHSL
jgi:hypothetical protein